VATGTAPNTDVTGINSLSTYNPSAGSFSSVYGSKSKAVLNNSGGTFTGVLIGTEAEASRVMSAYADSSLIGVNAKVTNSTGITSITNSYGVRSRISSTTGAANILANAYGMHSSLSASGANGITNGYAYYAGTITNATNKWSFYSADATAKNYFAGNVGVGTTNPTYGLHVVGPTGISSSRFSTDATGATINLEKSRGTEGSPTDLANNDVIGEHNFRGHAGVVKMTTARIAASASEAWSDFSRGTTLTFETAPNTTTTPTEKMRINHDGRIGVGTIDPATKLHVSSGGATPTGGFVTGTQFVAQISALVSDVARVSIIGGNAGWSTIEFGDSDDADVGRIQYNLQIIICDL
jgi:hypothetical protein